MNRYFLTLLMLIGASVAGADSNYGRYEHVNNHADRNTDTNAGNPSDACTTDIRGRTATDAAIQRTPRSGSRDRRPGRSA